MIFEAKDKVIIIDKSNIRKGRIAGRKGDCYLIEPRGVNFQPLRNNARMYWVDINNIEIRLHRRYKDELKLIKS